MLERIASGLMLTFLLTGMLAFAFNIQPAKSDPTTWTVDDDGPANFSTIQEAINAASSGDTIFVKNGTYYEHLVVDKKLSFLGEDRNSTILDGNRTETTVRIKADCVNISRFTIRNGYCVPHVTPGIEVHGYNNVVISDTVISQNDIGIFLYYSKGNIVENSLIFNNWRGICITFSDQNQLMNSSLFANQEVGIAIGCNADDNVICDNKIYDNGLCGITIGWSDYNEVVGNMLTCNNEAGIRLDASNNNYIVGNYIASNIRDGVVLYGSNSTAITKNTLTENGWDGIAVWCSYYNTVYHNNFLDNKKHASSYSESMNVWDDGYPSGGNYWSDYEERYPDSEEIGNSGIWDTPYVLDENNQDNYPLMCPWRVVEPPVVDLNNDGVVDVKDIAIVAIAFGSFPDHPRWNPVADLNQDDRIDLKDILIIARNFGKTY